MRLALQNHSPVVRGFEDALDFIAEIKSLHIGVSLDCPILGDQSDVAVRGRSLKRETLSSTRTSAASSIPLITEYPDSVNSIISAHFPMTEPSSARCQKSDTRVFSPTSFAIRC